MTIPEADAALAALGYRAATDERIADIAQMVLDRAAHDHPARGKDLYCLNLTSWMGERMGPVLVRLRDAEAERNALRTEVERLRGQRAALITPHEYEELIFGGFICLHCTPDDCDDPDDNVYWPCPSLRAVGVTDEEGVALITARRAENAARHTSTQEADRG